MERFDSATNTISGTSMAAPHVAGVVARFLQANTSATPLYVTSEVKRNASANRVTNPGANSGNAVLYSAFNYSVSRPSGTTPLYRYWNPSVTDHYYTTNFNELGNGAYGWTYERISGYIYPSQASGAVPLHQYWNASIGDHFFTINLEELGSSGSYGWSYASISGYVIP